MLKPLKILVVQVSGVASGGAAKYERYLLTLILSIFTYTDVLQQY